MGRRGEYFIVGFFSKKSKINLLPITHYLSMSAPIHYTKTPWQENYSEIIDVRSPLEFTEDHLPGAINLPVLDDEQRSKVGTIYKQVSPFQAKKVGAAIISSNIARHLEQNFAHHDKDYSPLVYCWRGGQRSHSLATVLSEIGWQVTILAGGYKLYRSYVREQLEQLAPQLRYKILCGLTGTGKTQILSAMAHKGAQVLDLEGLAHHRGSLLGQEWEDEKSLADENRANFVLQPSQKRFESLLLQQLQKFNPAEVVWLESESNKIGTVHIPSALWQMMQAGKCVEIKVPQEARIDLLLQEYEHLSQHRDILKSKLALLKSRHGKKKIQTWFNYIDEGKLRALVADLLTHHYDPSYHRSLSKSYYQRLEKSVQIRDLTTESLEIALNSFLGKKVQVNSF